MEISKEEFLSAMRVQLKEWEARLKAFQSQAGPPERALERHLQEVELGMLQASARQYLWELRSYPEKTWHPGRDGIADRWSRLRAGVEAMWLTIS